MKIAAPYMLQKSTCNIPMALLQFSLLCSPIHRFFLQSFLLTPCTLIHQIRNPFSSLILNRYVVTQECITGEGAKKKKKRESEKTNLHNHKTSISKSQLLSATLGLVRVFAKALVLHLCNCDKYRFYWGQRRSSPQSKEKNVPKL